MEVLLLYTAIFGGRGFPYINQIGEYLYFTYLKRLVKQQLVFRVYETDGWTKKRPALPRCWGCHLRPWHHLLTTGLGFLTSPKGAKIRMLGAGGKEVPAKSTKQSGWSLGSSMDQGFPGPTKWANVWSTWTDFLGKFYLVNSWIGASRVDGQSH